MKTEVINIGVPIRLYAEHSNNEIREMVINGLTERRKVEVDGQPIKYVTIAIRLPKAIATTIRRQADEYKLPITTYICKLLEGLNDNV